MTKVMLEAISTMLDIKDKDNAQLAMERVKCAKIMLDKIIEGMDQKITYAPLTKPQPDDDPYPGELDEVEMNNVLEPMYFPVLDDDHKIDQILMRVGEDKTEAPLDLGVVVDGVPMQYREAKGMVVTKDIKVP